MKGKLREYTFKVSCLVRATNEHHVMGWLEDMDASMIQIEQEGK
jgi:hypothetical protein